MSLTASLLTLASVIAIGCIGAFVVLPWIVGKSADYIPDQVANGERPSPTVKRGRAGSADRAGGAPHPSPKGLGHRRHPSRKPITNQGE
jgi:hypothetical protein